MTEMRPESGTMMFMIMRMVVVLPAPLGPMSPKTTPSPMENETSSTAVWSPNRLWIFSTSSTFMGFLSTFSFPRRRKPAPSLLNYWTFDGANRA